MKKKIPKGYIDIGIIVLSAFLVTIGLRLLIKPMDSLYAALFEKEKVEEVQGDVIRDMTLNVHISNFSAVPLNKGDKVKLYPYGYIYSHDDEIVPKIRVQKGYEGQIELMDREDFFLSESSEILDVNSDSDTIAIILSEDKIRKFMWVDNYIVEKIE
ncbi:hypothetical protein D3C81_08210 [compost metagenome]